MSYDILMQELKLPYCAFALARTNEEGSVVGPRFGCINQVFPYVAEHGAVVLGPESVGCRGALVGLGLCDGMPAIPGGFGNFIAQGAGAGCPPGERIKCNADVAERMLLSQPQNVMNGCSAVRVASYAEEEGAELVCLFANPDQLSALLHLFYFRSSGFDEVMVPVASGCAQLFRLPFGELARERPRAVLGNIDFFSRPHLGKYLLSFTVSAEAFRQMCADVPASFLYAPAWNGVKARL